MSWRDELLRSIESVAERTENLERDLSDAGYLDHRNGPRADNRRSGRGIGFEVQPILSGPRGEAVADGADARAENAGRKRAAESRRDRKGGVSFDVTPVMSGPAGDAAVDGQD